MSIRSNSKTRISYEKLDRSRLFASKVWPRLIVRVDSLFSRSVIVFSNAITGEDVVILRWLRRDALSHGLGFLNSVYQKCRIPVHEMYELSVGRGNEQC